jgi:hypothetical protein
MVNLESLRIKLLVTEMDFHLLTGSRDSTSKGAKKEVRYTGNGLYDCIKLQLRMTIEVLTLEHKRIK